MSGRQIGFAMTASKSDPRAPVMNLKSIRLTAKLWLATGLIVLGLCAVIGFAAVRSADDRAASTAALDAMSAKAKLTVRWAALTETNAARFQAVLLSSGWLALFSGQPG